MTVLYFAAVFIIFLVLSYHISLKNNAMFETTQSQKHQMTLLKQYLLQKPNDFREFSCFSQRDVGDSGVHHNQNRCLQNTSGKGNPAFMPMETKVIHLSLSWTRALMNGYVSIGHSLLRVLLMKLLSFSFFLVVLTSVYSFDSTAYTAENVNSLTLNRLIFSLVDEDSVLKSVQYTTRYMFCLLLLTHLEKFYSGSCRGYKYIHRGVSSKPRLRKELIDMSLKNVDLRKSSTHFSPIQLCNELETVSCQSKKIFRNQMPYHFFQFRTHQNFLLTYSINPVTFMSHFHCCENGIPQAMQKEGMRLLTFLSFPKTSVVSVLRLAFAGFYYTSEDDKVRCFSCGVTYQGWKRGDKPLDIHANISASCPLVQGQDQLNIAIASAPYSLQQQQSENLESRLPIAELPGLQYNDSSNAEFTRRLSLQEDSHSVLPVPTAISELSIASAVYPVFSLITQRQRSFQNRHHVFTSTQINDLSNLGFFYSEEEEQCYIRCFYCGHSFAVAPWTDETDPAIIHAELSQDCRYLRLIMRGNFVDRVNREIINLSTSAPQTQHENFRSNDESASTNTHSTRQSDSHSASILSTPALITVSETALSSSSTIANQLNVNRVNTAPRIQDDVVRHHLQLMRPVVQDWALSSFQSMGVQLRGPRNMQSHPVFQAEDLGITIRNGPVSLVQGSEMPRDTTDHSLHEQDL